MGSNRRTLLALTAGAAFLLPYGPVLWRLAQDWLHDDNYSHGVLIIPLAAYFAWERRGKIAEAAARSKPGLTGLLLVVCALALLLAGLLGVELFMTRVSLLAALAGSIIFLFGWPTFRVLLFPLAFLLLMIPIPSIIFNQIAFPLQILASRVGEAGLVAAGVPVLREGNVMILANTTLEVAEACSGIRSLISLLTLGVVLGYFTDPRSGVRVAVAAASVPIAILTNGLRVAGTGIAAHYVGPEAAEGFFHEFSGWLVFVVAFALVFLTAQLIVRMAPRPSHGQAAPATA